MSDHRVQLPKEGLRMWVIYDHPRDFPGHFVIRGTTVHAGGQVPDRDVQLADTLQAARELLPPGLVCLERAPEDDPVIVESWL